MDSEEISRRLVECEQQLAATPDLERNLERALAENAALRAELEATRSQVHELTDSASWKLTAPLRRLRGLRGG